MLAMNGYADAKCVSLLQVVLAKVKEMKAQEEQQRTISEATAGNSQKR